jgi:hypothetical protein
MGRKANAETTVIDAAAPAEYPQAGGALATANQFSHPHSRSDAERKEAAALTVKEMLAQLKVIDDLMKRIMKEGIHYGVIPGTSKPTLLQPGAQLLCKVFRMDAEFETTNPIDSEGHMTVTSRCTLYQIGTGFRLGMGMGLCTTRESRYAYREAKRTCPQCGKETIIKGKEEYGGGWLCWAKKGGCNAKFADGEAIIEDQETGQIANENLSDCYNTAVKIGNKRGLISAVLNVTGASDRFTQDMEDVEASERMKKENRDTFKGKGNQRPAKSGSSEPSGQGNTVADREVGDKIVKRLTEITDLDEAKTFYSQWKSWIETSGNKEVGRVKEAFTAWRERYYERKNSRAASANGNGGVQATVETFIADVKAAQTIDALGEVYRAAAPLLQQFANTPTHKKMADAYKEARNILEGNGSIQW